MKHHQLLRRGLSVLLSLVMCLTLVPVTALAATGVTIDKTNFPDQVFREYVSKNCDTNGDGTLSTEEIAAVTSITFFNNTGAELADLTGIEHFTNLGSLCYDSSNLTTLDVSKNTALVRLECYNSKLTTLNLGENTALKSLWCNGNNLTTLDVSKNTALEKLYCNNNNLTTLDVSKNTGLSYLFCFCNNLTKLDVSKNTKLEALHCSKNNLTSMDVSKTVVETLGCEGNTYTIMLSPQN